MFTRKEITILALLASIQFCHILDFVLMMPLGPSLIRIFGNNAQQFSHLVASYTFSAGIVGFVASFWVDRFDRKQTLLACFVGFAVGTLGCALAPSYELLMLARIGAGAFGGVLSSTVLAIVGDAIAQERRATAIGIVSTAFSVASIVGVPLALGLSVAYSWHTPFFVLAGMGIGLALAGWFALPPVRSHLNRSEPRIAPWASLGKLAHNPNQLRALALMMLLMISHFSIVVFFASYFVNNVGITEAQLSYIYVVGGLGSLIAMPFFGRLADRYGRYRVLVFLGLLSFGPSILMTSIGPIGLTGAVAVATGFFVFNSSRMVPAMAMITSTVVPANRGSFMGLASSVQAISSGLAAHLAGLLVGIGPGKELLHFEHVGYLSVTTTLLCLLVAAGIRPVDMNIEPQATVANSEPPQRESAGTPRPPESSIATNQPTQERIGAV